MSWSVQKKGGEVGDVQQLQLYFRMVSSLAARTETNTLIREDDDEDEEHLRLMHDDEADLLPAAWRCAPALHEPSSPPPRSSSPQLQLASGDLRKSKTLNLFSRTFKALYESSVLG